MNVSFQINYRAEYGQTLCIIETKTSILGWTEEKPLMLSCHGQDFWTVTIPVSDFAGEIQYKYAIRVQNGQYIYEGGEPRTLNLHNEKKLVVRDFWQTDDYEKAFYTTAFKEALFRRVNNPCTKKTTKEQTANLRFSIALPQILPTQGVAVMGNIPELGNWNADDKLTMCDCDFPVWRAAVKAQPNQIIEYKYVIYDLRSGAVVDMEWGENRVVWGLQDNVVIEQNDRAFRRTQPRFKGAGVAVPVFSLRTEDGFGIGEFQDLKKLADWAVRTGQKMIQTLPINDTTLTHTNTDSYPYNAVSVFALHPIYINI